LKELNQVFQYHNINPMDIITALDYLATKSTAKELEKLRTIDNIFDIEKYIRHCQRVIVQLNFERDRLNKPVLTVESQDNELYDVKQVMAFLHIKSKNTLTRLKKLGVLMPVNMTSEGNKTDRTKVLYKKFDLDKYILTL